MEQLIDKELEGVDTRINDVEALKQKLMDALAQYHDLVSRVPAYVSQPYQQPAMPYQVSYRLFILNLLLRIWFARS